MKFLSKIGVALAIAAGALGLSRCEQSAGRNPPGSKRFPVPGAGVVELPERFVADSGATRLVPMEVLMVYGNRKWSVGGHQRIGEALAVGSKARFSDLEEFRKQAAHYLGDADWRTLAMGDLAWQRLDFDGRPYLVAALPQDQSDRKAGPFVILPEEEHSSLFVVAFAKAPFRDRAIAAIAMALESHSATLSPDSP